MRTVNTAVASTTEDMSVVDFWENKYLPYCEREWKGTGMRNSTVRGFKQVWKQHLKTHFGTITLQKYAPQQARTLSVQPQNQTRKEHAKTHSRFG